MMGWIFFGLRLKNVFKRSNPPSPEVPALVLGAVRLHELHQRRDRRLALQVTQPQLTRSRRKLHRKTRY